MPIDVDTVRRALRGRKHVEAHANEADRFAAVSLVLRQREPDAEILLIRRAENEGDPWSGHMAFPGGRQDPADPDLLHTAVRETAEEVSLSLDPDRELIGRLDDLPAVARGRRIGMIIVPFIFAVDDSGPLRPRAGEVDEALWTPLSPLAAGERDTTYSYPLEGKRYALPAYDVDGKIVWGLTHRMLAALFEVLDGQARDL